jgi:hydrogenase nickel incorporation protein HypB
VEYNLEYFRKGVEMLNPGLTTFPVSCRTGEGFDAWIAWLKESVKQYKQGK